MNSCRLIETLTVGLLDLSPTEATRHQSQEQEVENIEERA